MAASNYWILRLKNFPCLSGKNSILLWWDRYRGTSSSRRGERMEFMAIPFSEYCRPARQLHGHHCHGRDDHAHLQKGKQGNHVWSPKGLSQSGNNDGNDGGQSQNGLNCSKVCKGKIGPLHPYATATANETRVAICLFFTFYFLPPPFLSIFSPPNLFFAPNNLLPS